MYKPIGKLTSKQISYSIETFTLTGQELAVYCRRKDLYTEDIKNWRGNVKEQTPKLLKTPPLIKEYLKEEK